MTHTPGPWDARRLADGWQIGAGSSAVVGVGYEGDGGVYFEADARLIAAAPDLYAALKAARREHLIVDDCFYTCAAAKYEDGEWATCNDDSGEHKCKCGADAINAVIDAALAKAEQP